MCTCVYPWLRLGVAGIARFLEQVGVVSYEVV